MLALVGKANKSHKSRALHYILQWMMLGLSYLFNELEVVGIGEEELREERGGGKGSPLNLECIKQRVIMY